MALQLHFQTVVVLLAALFLSTSYAQPCKSEKASIVISGKAGSTKRATVKTHDTFQVALPVQLGTGFNWSVSESEPGLIGSVLTEICAGQASLGGQQMFVASFTAANKGKVTLSFALQRPWEKDKPPAQRFVLHLSIVPPK
jgi:predicted secreted protein